MKSLTDRSADLRLLHFSRASSDSNAFLSVFIDSVKLDKPAAIIPGTKTKLEVSFGKISEKLSVEVRPNITNLTIEKAIQFEFKHEADLSFTLYKKSPLINISTGVIAHY